MPYTLEHHKNKNAILITFYDDFVIPDDPNQYTSEVIAILDQCTQAQTIIYDYRDITVTLDLLMRATEYSRYNEGADITKHPLFGQNILVSENRVLEMSLNGFKKFGFGDKMSIVSSLDEAYTLCQEK